MKCIVYHAEYGCDTGCCGHVVEMDDGRHTFSFDHPNGENYSTPSEEDCRKFAESLVRDEFGEEHVADLDWENCIVLQD